MAKTSQVARNDKRKRLAAKYSEKRKTLKAIMKSPNSSPEEVMEAMQQLSAIPRNASPTRVRNRCRLTGRSRSYVGDFEVCRHELRRLVNLGVVVGVRKSSW